MAAATEAAMRAVKAERSMLRGGEGTDGAGGPVPGGWIDCAPLLPPSCCGAGMCGSEEEEEEEGGAGAGLRPAAERAVGRLCPGYRSGIDTWGLLDGWYSSRSTRGPRVHSDDRRGSPDSWGKESSLVQSARRLKAVLCAVCDRWWS